MVKLAHDDILDAALDYIINNTTVMTAVTGCTVPNTTPTVAQAVGSWSLAQDQTMTAGNYQGPENGTPDGRSITVETQSGLTVGSTGTATHVMLVGSTGGASGRTILYTTTCTPQKLTAANTVDFGSWDIRIADPT